MTTEPVSTNKLHLINTDLNEIKKRFDEADDKTKLYKLAVPLGRIVGRPDFHQFSVVCATRHDLILQAIASMNDMTYECLPQNLEVLVLDQCKITSAYMLLIFSSSKLEKFQTFIIGNDSAIEKSDCDYLPEKIRNYRLPETVTILVSYDPFFSGLEQLVNIRNFRTIALGPNYEDKMIPGEYDDCKVVLAEYEPAKFSAVIDKFNEY